MVNMRHATPDRTRLSAKEERMPSLRLPSNSLSPLANLYDPRLQDKACSSETRIVSSSGAQMLPIHQQLQEIQATWIEATKQPSGNLASNAPLPRSIRDQLFSADSLDMSQLDTIEFFPREWPDAPHVSQEFPGLHQIIGLQRLSKPEHLTLYRSIRFPTPKRVVDALRHDGVCLDNFEQERLRLLYTDDHYLRQREQILSKREFQFLPQERIVSALPVFLYANDALQVHSAFRQSRQEIVLLAVCYIPKSLLINGSLTLSGNPPFALSFDDSSFDFQIEAFVEEDGRYVPNLAQFRSVGIELYETYLRGFPREFGQLANLGITTSFFVVMLQKIDKPIAEQLGNLHCIPESLRTSELYGVFGNWSSFFRRPTRYLPTIVAEPRLVH
jgi:hypothetical protein